MPDTRAPLTDATKADALAVRPLETALALHAEFYADPAWLAFEQREVFGASWQLAAHQGELVNAGDHVVADIAGKSVLIVRQADGSLKGFHNVCRHRAGPIAMKSGTGATSLRCAYHGWTYKLDGQLKMAPEMNEACDFHKEDIRLTGIRVHEWQGLVFVALSDDVPPFDEVYAGITDRIAPVDLSKMKYTRRDSYDIACNWKVYIDNFLEGYHLPYVHPGLSKVLDYRAYDTELFPWYSLQHSPLRGGEGIYGGENAWYYFIYPNIMLNIVDGRMQTNRILPNGNDRCIVEFDYYYAQDDETQSRIAADQEFSDEVQAEDIEICEHVQIGLQSGVYTAGRLCPKRESGVWHFQNLLRKAYARRG
ncbi:aromatic ring-hydroxylating oxygenase subunit alpha [Gimibacter soli]|uniref:Aromatic ring-hydroxylating dioxygenase subunit alpha n=1 Tax=Gimibacter soli TaxID=3024400 RepID=A0AAE9XRW6_9PROT|nr:aromatic ring-hydroxylating dioxygenase subunit alpha [Gimibacter soli]WCL54111.1 aromatic ring-hydroxylating dioxygenase subunit alpha [Gimibacter soli]